MSLVIITAPTATPIDLDDAKRHLAITGNVHDVTVQSKLKAATDFCRRRINGHRQFMATTYDVSFDTFPDRVTLPMPPLGSVTSVKYFDADGAEQTLSSTAYDVTTPSEAPGYIEPAYNETWPSVRGGDTNAITVRFVAGTTSTEEVPDTIKEAVRIKLEHLWDPGRVKQQDVDNAVDNLLGGNDYGGYS